MTERKVYCEILEGVTFSDRCLWRLSKVIEGNKACEDCIFRELQTLKRCGVKKAEAGPLKKCKVERKKSLKAAESIPKDIKKPKDIRKSEEIKRPGDMKTSEGVGNRYSVKDIGELLGKSERRIQELASEGRLPGRKVGRHWVFDKENIDRWLSEKGYCPDIVHILEGHSNEAVITMTTAPPGGRS